MSSSACCSARHANAYECQWNCEHELKCDSTLKANGPTRRKREFTPNELKDDNYWMKRNRNNEAAKRSRERRRMEERLLEERALQLLRENEKLKAALSAINYHSVGTEASYETFMCCSPVRELSRDSYLRSVLSDPGANPIAHYARDFRAAYDSVPVPRMQSFPAAAPAAPVAAFPAGDHAQHRDRPPGIHAPSDGNLPSRTCISVPYAITQRKWCPGHADPTMNLHPKSAPFPLNKIAPAFQCPAGSTRGCAAHTRMTETHTEQRPSLTEPADPGKEAELVREAERVSTSPLLPHKLRYKVNKLLLGAERAHSPPRISHYFQE